MIDCYCHVQIHAVPMTTFYMYTNRSPCTVTNMRAFSSLVSRTGNVMREVRLSLIFKVVVARQQSVLGYMFVRCAVSLFWPMERESKIWPPFLETSCIVT